MTLLELKTSALRRADETPGDSMLDGVALDGINQGYMILATLVDKQYNSSTVPYAKTIAVPADFCKLVDLSVGNVILGENDYTFLGTKIRINNSDYSSGNIDINYVKYPSFMTTDSEIPVIKLGLHQYIALYGAYTVLLQKKKYNSATALLNEFMVAINGGGNNDAKGTV